MDDDNKTTWPAWFYGPEGASQVFQNEDEVPEGWVDHPNKVGEPKRGKKEDTPGGEDEFKDLSDAQIIDKLKTSNAEFSDKWPRHKLVAVLKGLR